LNNRDETSFFCLVGIYPLEESISPSKYITRAGNKNNENLSCYSRKVAREQEVTAYIVFQRDLHHVSLRTPLVRRRDGPMENRMQTSLADDSTLKTNQ
jgi:hypothetical protein